MKTGIIVMNFGEPAEPTEAQVVPFLERIFLQNAGLERIPDPEARRARARELAEARAPGLMEEYREIGGSPLNEQADAQARAVERVLLDRGHEVVAYSGYQYTEPFIDDVVGRARDDGMERLVGLPIYPLCGHSTTVAALEDLATAVAARDGWDPVVLEVSGWHRHPDFYALHADHIAEFCRSRELDLTDPETAFLFSIHGTPLKYLEGGNRYDRYVDEACAGIAGLLGLERYHMGYQNHSNRPIHWTQPDVETVVEGLDVARVVVHPVAFLHEQSETLAELDHELREEAEEVGLEFHRVPVPHDDPRLASLLADVVEARLDGEPAGHPVQLRRCFCRDGGQSRCTNGLRLSSEVVPAEDARARA
jgi:ferrochelatase